MPRCGGLPLPPAGGISGLGRITAQPPGTETSGRPLRGGKPHTRTDPGGEMRTAVLFPGQGSQTSDMRDTVARLRPDLYEFALDEVGNDLFDRASENTEFAQPAIYCASLAGWSRFEGERPYAMAGHSLGEFAALAAAGALDDATGLRLVALRGRLMQRVAERTGEGGMLAVGTRIDDAGELAERFGLTVANDNSPEQVVLSGSADALERAAELASDRGARARRLRVAGA